MLHFARVSILWSLLTETSAEATVLDCKFFPDSAMFTESRRPDVGGGVAL